MTALSVMYLNFLLLLYAGTAKMVGNQISKRAQDEGRTCDCDAAPDRIV